MAIALAMTLATTMAIAITDLLDRRAAVILEALRVLPSLAGVGLASESIHRDGERLVGLSRYGAFGMARYNR